MSTVELLQARTACTQLLVRCNAGGDRENVENQVFIAIQQKSRNHRAKI